LHLSHARLSSSVSAITEHFVRIAFVDALKAFKASVPRKKKQALRSKIKAIGERDNKKKKISNDNLEVNVSAYLLNMKYIFF
jgi:hypothetical protein